ncbi:hypothetical protein E2542_SST24947 [Spatholobus suberectus]|nr:hypothetical protein E2542_SST24947 [Spatholobus suberectus]
MNSVAGPFDSVKDIYGGRDTWRLKVRVIWMWNVCSLCDPSSPFAIEMVLIDSEGGKIQATIRKPMMKKFGKYVVEGEVYKMAFFGVLRNTGSYRATKHKFKLLFSGKTKVIHCESEIIPTLDSHC